MHRKQAESWLDHYRENGFKTGREKNLILEAAKVIFTEVLDPLVAQGKVQKSNDPGKPVYGLASDKTWVYLGDMFDDHGTIHLASYLSRFPSPSDW